MDSYGEYFIQVLLFPSVLVRQYCHPCHCNAKELCNMQSYVLITRKDKKAGSIHTLLIKDKKASPLYHSNANLAEHFNTQSEYILHAYNYSLSWQMKIIPNN